MDDNRCACGAVMVRERLGPGCYYWHCEVCGQDTYIGHNLAMRLSSSAFAERTPPSCALPGLSAVLAPGGK
jgi:hypothetical protein